MINESDTAILLIDVQEKLFGAIHEHSLLKQQLILAIKAFQLLNIPIITTEQYPKGLGKTIPEIRALLNSQEIYEKITFSALSDEAIAKTVSSFNKTHWIIMGLEAHICILQTVHALIAKNKSVLVIEECVGSRNPMHKKLAIGEMNKNNVRISCIETLLFELLGHANHTKFKEISALIR